MVDGCSIETHYLHYLTSYLSIRTSVPLFLLGTYRVPNTESYCQSPHFKVYQKVNKALEILQSYSLANHPLYMRTSQGSVTRFLISRGWEIVRYSSDLRFLCTPPTTGFSIHSHSCRSHGLLRLKTGLPSYEFRSTATSSIPAIAFILILRTRREGNAGVVDMPGIVPKLGNHTMMYSHIK